MFLNKKVFKRLMTQAYKEGLKVAMSFDGWLYLAGQYWEVSIKKDFIPKETLGDIITLIGELPAPGERFSASKEGNQMEFDSKLEVSLEPFKNKDTLAVTNVILIGMAGTQQRILQDKEDGDIYAVNNVFINIINNAEIMEQKGEYAVNEPFYEKCLGVLWMNNVCRLHAAFRMDRKNDKVFEALRGLDITPEAENEV